MIKIPPALIAKYDRLLVNSEAQPKEYPAYRKWFRYYLDFCKKYDHEYADSESLLLFVDKLKAKKQNLFQQNQAQKAVKLYYAGLEKQTQAQISAHNHSEPIPVIQEGASPFNTGNETYFWDQSIQSLKNEIQVRHYSR